MSQSLERHKYAMLPRGVEISAVSLPQNLSRFTCTKSMPVILAKNGGVRNRHLLVCRHRNIILLDRILKSADAVAACGS